MPLAQAGHASLLDEATDDGAAWIGQWLDQIRLAALATPFLAPVAHGAPAGAPSRSGRADC